MCNGFKAEFSFSINNIPIEDLCCCVQRRTYEQRKGSPTRDDPSLFFAQERVATAFSIEQFQEFSDKS
jgi:hypothetical protein